MLACFLWQIRGTFSRCRNCHEFAIETLGTFENFACCRENKKACKYQNLQALKAFRDVLYVLGNFKNFALNRLRGLARTILEHLYKRFINIGAAFGVRTLKN